MLLDVENPATLQIVAQVPHVTRGGLDLALAAADRAGTEDHQACVAEVTPLRRVGRPEEAAAAIAFLASDDASYVSGQTLYINGGAR